MVGDSHSYMSQCTQKKTSNIDESLQGIIMSNCHTKTIKHLGPDILALNTTGNPRESRGIPGNPGAAQRLAERQSPGDKSFLRLFPAELLLHAEARPPQPI